jgi:Ankyrin repeats (3 copies)/Ankyrin repeats (many copies)
MKRKLATVLLLALAWSSLAFCSEIQQAIMFDDLAKVKALLKDHPDWVNHKEDDGTTALYLAILYDHKEIIELLLTNNAEVSIHDAAAIGNLEKVKALLKANPDLVNSKDNGGMMPLHWAAMCGHKDVAELLLANKADVNATDNAGQTPLRLAEETKYQDVAELLRQHGGHESVTVKRPEHLYIPFLEPASQSNVVVTVSSIFAAGDPCPAKYTNVLSNTNLFTAQEQKLIGEALVKYRNVTTNSGPPGTVLVDSYETNLIIPPLYWLGTNRPENVRRTNQIWVAHFQYTNSDAQEEIRFGAGVSAKFTNQSKDGYTASITRTGGGTSLLTVTEIKPNSASGLLARFADLHEQGPNWDYKLADFTDGHLEEYMQMTNGMLLGRWFMWNPGSGGLILEAESKVPYDWNNHRMKLP